MSTNVVTGTSVRKVHCAQCGGLRNCEVRAHHAERHDEEPVQWRIDWYILECRGCEHVFAQTVATDSETYDHDYDQDGELQTYYLETVRYWPSLAKRVRPPWMTEIGITGVELPDAGKLFVVLDELYTALDNDLRTLSGIGIRTAFDVASEALGVEPSLPFKLKLDALADKNCISLTEASRLGVLVNAGNAAAHRGWRPEQSELIVMMDVLEGFIDAAFVQPARTQQLDQQVEELKGRVPAKGKAGKAEGNPALPAPLI